MQAPLFLSDPTYLLLVVGILFVHICYQLSVSVLTHFSSHSLSRRVSEKRLLLLGSSYGLGAVITTSLIITGLVTLSSFTADKSQTLMTIAVGLAPFIGLATILWYYRRGKGTRLWLPRPIADYLLKRSKKTKSAVEASMLGAATVVGELPFLFGPLLFIAFLISREPGASWIVWSSLYSILAYLPLLFVTMYLTSGHSIARVQRWREENKSFLQWTSGVTLVLLTIYLTVLQMGVAQ
jgi:hypothetical protein